ncbi:MAG: helix-turn-helix domain-containing protein [Anaerosomatales bacterium]|nr:helix-turn-helix domain-containing protein [Anaerosomatales bacterium]
MQQASAEAAERLLVSVQEASRMLGVHRCTLYELMNSGALKPVKIGRRTLVPVAELEGFVERLQRSA